MVRTIALFLVLAAARGSSAAAVLTPAPSI
jgi:hypothetical protein